jgi:hypothetical protein
LTVVAKSLYKILIEQDPVPDPVSFRGCIRIRIQIRFVQKSDPDTDLDPVFSKIGSGSASKLSRSAAMLFMLYDLRAMFLAIVMSLGISLPQAGIVQY